MDIETMSDFKKFKTLMNPTTSEDILQQFATKDYWVRDLIARHPRASSTFLVILFEKEKSLKEPNSHVIKSLYKNENLPTFAKRVIETLYGDML